MLKIKMLYGSQNFGYNDINSDKDYLQFVIPSWNNILKNELVSKEYKNSDGSITKIKDIRLIPKMIEKANFNDLQFLYAKEQEGTEILKWFYLNKDLLIRANLRQCYYSNCGFILGQLRELTSKNLIRAYAHYQLLKQFYENKKKIKFFDETLQSLRIEIEQMNNQEKEELKKYILEGINNYREFFDYQEKDIKIFPIINKKIKEILKDCLRNY